MSALVWFLVWAALIFLMMRFGCGAHVMGHGRGQPDGNSDGKLRWQPPATDIDPVCGKKVKTDGAKPSVFNGLVYYFCSRDCREVFEAAPHLYASNGTPGSPAKLEKQYG